MPLRNFLTLLPEHAASRFLGENVSRFLRSESDGVEPAVGSQTLRNTKKKLHRNDERSLNVIENTGGGRGRTWKVIENKCG